jgi:hypothetical protein
LKSFFQELFYHLDREIPLDESSDEEEVEKLESVQQTKQPSPPKIAWKHSWPLNQTQDALLNSPFSNIPTEVLIQIFRSFSVRDLGNVALVCRSFKMIVDQDEIWKLKCNSELSDLFGFLFTSLSM